VHPTVRNQGNGRGYGWDIVKRTPGLVDKQDVQEVIEAPGPVEQVGPYDVVIGDNPDGDGKIQLWLLDGVVIQASYSAYDSTRKKSVSIEDDVVNEIFNKKDWDHNQIGSTKGEIRENLRKIVENPDEIWKETGTDRWMYVKK
jgi:hypothetical protein